MQVCLISFAGCYIYVEHEERRYGPFGPIDGPIPLNRYRRFRKTATDERIERIEELANRLGLPRAALEGPGAAALPAVAPVAPPSVPFTAPDPFHQSRFASVLAAKLAIADYLGRPLPQLTEEDRAHIETLLAETLDRHTVIACVRGYFRERERGHRRENGDHAD